MANGIHTELTFEEAIESSLLEQGGYVKGLSQDFDANLGLFPSYIFDFLKESQPTLWSKIENIHKSDVETKVLQRFVDKIKSFGSDVASNILANLLTNPKVYDQLGGML